MAKPRGGLGRGLAALIEPEAPAGGSARLRLGPHRIRRNPRQPGRTIDADRLSELSRSIQETGIVQPVVVRRLDDGDYELVAGERRWRAAQLAGLEQIPAMVREADDDTSLLVALVENVVREDLNAVEVARGYAALTDEVGLTPAEVGERVGKSRSTVVNTLRLLELPDDVLELVASGTISEGHGRAILQAPEHAARRALARRVVKEELSVRQTEALARSSGAVRRRRASGPEWYDESLGHDAVDACYRAFGLSARVSATGGGCRIELSVTSPEELQTLVARLEALGSAPGDGAAPQP